MPILMFNVSDLESWEAWDWIAIAIGTGIGNEERKVMVVDNRQWIWIRIWRLALGINFLLILQSFSRVVYDFLSSVVYLFLFLSLISALLLWRRPSADRGSHRGILASCAPYLRPLSSLR